MKTIIFRMIFVCACVLTASVAASGQELENASTAVLKDTGKASVVVVRSAAKLTWVITKVAVKTTVKPAAKMVFQKAAPAAGKFALKKSAKHLLPIAVKFAAL